MLKGYIRKRLTVSMENDGNEYILGRVSGMVCAGRIGNKNYAIALDKFNDRIYLAADVFPWEYRKIRKTIESNYPGKCKFFY